MKNNKKSEDEMKAYEFLAIKGTWNGKIYNGNVVYKNNEKYVVEDSENIERIRSISEWIYGNLDRRLRIHWDRELMKSEIKILVSEDLFPKIKFDKSPVTKEEIFILAEKMAENIYFNKERQIVIW